MDIGNAITGAIPIKVAGRINDDGIDEGLNVEADLTPVKIDNLFPGWTKPAGRTARASYKMLRTARSVRIDDLNIDGSGTTIRGSVELDGSTNEIVSANFPVFALSDGDRVAVKADRAADGVLHVSMRGDIYDGRPFVKSSLVGSSADKSKQKQVDLDLEVKVGTVAGHNGETLRGLDLKMSRRGGHVRSFVMASKIGRDKPFNGDLRIRSRDNHQVIYFETDDAGALFRFTDMYPRMHGGQMWLAMDPPTQEQSPQIGTLYIRRFVVRGEPALDKIVSGASNSPGGPVASGVDFSDMRAEFTRFPGKMAIRDGIVRGPLVGATVEGNVDYVRDDVHLRGTFVPFYGLNNMRHRGAWRRPDVDLLPQAWWSAGSRCAHPARRRLHRRSADQGWRPGTWTAGGNGKRGGDCGIWCRNCCGPAFGFPAACAAPRSLRSGPQVVNSSGGDLWRKHRPAT